MKVINKGDTGHWYANRLNRARIRFGFAALVVLLLGALIAFPNQVTHECKPTLRTQSGVVEHDGYNYDKGFCDEGYEPKLKFVLRSVYSNSLNSIFAFPFIVGGLVVLFFLVRKK